MADELDGDDRRLPTPELVAWRLGNVEKLLNTLSKNLELLTRSLVSKDSLNITVRDLQKDIEQVRKDTTNEIDDIRADFEKYRTNQFRIVITFVTVLIAPLILLTIAHFWS